MQQYSTRLSQPDAGLLSAASPVKLLPVQKLFQGTVYQAGDPVHLAHVTHEPHGGGVGHVDDGDKYYQQDGDLHILSLCKSGLY